MTTLPLSQRVEMWVKCGMPVKAGEEAAKAKDVDILHELVAKASGQQAIELERTIRQVKGKR